MPFEGGSLKILLVAPYGPDRQFSIGAFGRALHEGLAARGVDVRTVAPSPSRLGRVSRRIIGRRAAFVDKFLAFPPMLRRAAKEADLVHILEHGYAPYVHHLRDRRHTVACHDLIVAKAALGLVEGWPLSRPAKRYMLAILKGLSSAHHVTAMSEHTRKEVLELCHRTPETVSMVYHGLYRAMAPMGEVAAREALRNYTLPQGPWLLHVAGSQPNKNREGSIDIVHALAALTNPPISLVFAGAPLTPALEERIRSTGHPELFYRVERPSDDGINALYSLATATLVPSLHEGFGLPIIEAQACGCPVFSTGWTPMTEVGGDSVVYFDPRNPEEAARIIAEELPQAHRQREPGLRNVSRFTIDGMCRDYLDVYREVLS